MAVKMTMNTTGFMPRKMDFTGTLETAMDTASSRNMMP